jgi:hypothetical protein
MIRSKTFVCSIALFAGLALFTAPASAQFRPWEISIAGGPTLATGNFADIANTGYHVQGSFGIGIPLFPVGLRADAIWQEMPADPGEGMYKQVGGIANVTLGMPLILIEPYVLGGIGFFRQDVPNDAVESTTETGFNVGAGLEAGLLGLKGFAEVRYLDAGNDVRTIPITVGIRF